MSKTFVIVYRCIIMTKIQFWFSDSKSFQYIITVLKSSHLFSNSLKIKKFQRRVTKSQKS